MSKFCSLGFVSPSRRCITLSADQVPGLSTQAFIQKIQVVNQNQSGSEGLVQPRVFFSNDHNKINEPRK